MFYDFDIDNDPIVHSNKSNDKIIKYFTICFNSVTDKARKQCTLMKVHVRRQGPVSLRLMTSQFKDIATHTKKYMTVKCTFYGVWVQNFVGNFKGAL